MYVIVRLILVCVLLGFSIVTIKKSKAARKRTLYATFASISVMLYIVLVFLPFENLFVTFDSANSAYSSGSALPEVGLDRARNSTSMALFLSLSAVYSGLEMVSESNRNALISSSVIP